MRGLAADDDAEADDRVVPPQVGELLGGQGDLEAPRHPDDGEVLLRGAVADQGVDRALEEPLGHEVVEPAHDDGDAHPAGVELARDHFHSVEC